MAKKKQVVPEQVFRVKVPRDKQSIGIVETRLGGSKMRVRCFDGKTRLCRIPGRLKRRLWVRAGNYVLVEPWEYGGDEKGDLLYKYRPNQVAWLKRKGYIKEVIEDLEEF
ncbi:MAG: translation initiation factor eIF-1A [Nanoarchaeota archaeon]|nr:translation initiation factor eIF-1A [Nanoarchaeota archaeon]